jgi:hypothetical protein
VAGLVAGAVSWGAGELAYGAFQPPLSKVTTGTIVLIMATRPDSNAADAKNATLAFAILGSVLGLFLGVAGGLVRRNLLRGVWAGAVGLVLGGLAGAFASLPLLGLYYRQLVPNPNDLMRPLLTHGGIWCAVGATGGLAFGLGSGNWRRLLNAISGAILGAALATALYEGIGIAAFPASSTTEPLPPSWDVRLLARVLVSVFAALGAAAGAWEPAPPKSEAVAEV